MTSLKRCLAAAASLALAFTAACGGDTGAQQEQDAGSTAYGLAVSGSAVLTIHPGDVRNLQVVLAQNQIGPVPNADIAFAIDDGDPAGAQLDASTAQTGTDGTATVKLTAGSKTQFKVVVSAPAYPDVRPVAFSINVIPVKRVLQVVGGPNTKVSTDAASATVTMFISTSVGLKVRLLDQDTGAPIAGEQIDFALPQTAKSSFSGTSSKSANAKTGADGSAQVFVISTAQTELNVISTAQVDSGGVGSVTFSINVQASGTNTGCTVNSQCQPGQICSGGTCTSSTGGGSCQAGNDQQCPFGYDCVDGQCVPPANTQCDPNNPNCPAGQYCLCSASTGAQVCSCTDVCPVCTAGTTCNPNTHTCDPNPPPLPDVTGVWYTKHTFSIVQALPNFLQQMAKIIRQIDQLISGQFFTGALSWLNAIVKAIIDQYVPDWVQTVIHVLDDIGTILSYLRSEGSMNLKPVSGSFVNVAGSEVWTSLVFYWLPLCNGNIGGDPAIPPDCARFDVSTTDSDNPGDNGECKGQSIPAVAVQVQPFRAHVTGTDPNFTLNVDERTVNLKLGKVILIVINLLISYLTEYQCIDDALDCQPGNPCLIDCQALGQTIENLTGGFIPGSLVEGICYPLVTAAGQFITNILANISFETDVLDFTGHSSISKLSLSGSADNTTCNSGINCANQLGTKDYDYKTQKDPTHRDGWWEGSFFLKTIKGMPGGYRGTREPESH
ncbi:MAG: hypothetical protein JST92_14720 [Deltaproteobacteria bacterium]|nr:hypothetical protein [Deltaproteobacteria bacterium]